MARLHRPTRIRQFTGNRSVGLTLALLAASVCQTTFAQSEVEAPRPSQWKETRPPVEAAQPLPPIPELIAALNSDRFAEREQASRVLSRHSIGAVAPLAGAAQSAQPEVAVRGLNALENLWMRAMQRNDTTVANAALEALDQLSVAEDNPELRERVAALFAAHESQIFDYDLAQVKQLGGTIRVTEGMLIPDVDALDNDPTFRPVIQSIIIGRRWTGGVEGLRHVRRLLRPDGDVYFIRGGKLPEDIATTFSAQPPYIRSQIRGPAHLGVGADVHGVGCRITNVEPGSSADRGGIRIGDVIISFNNVPVRTFETLVKEIGEIEPQTTVPATVQRGEQTVDLKITMQEWK